MQDPWADSAPSQGRYDRPAPPPQFRAQTPAAPQAYQQPQFQPVPQRNPAQQPGYYGRPQGYRPQPPVQALRKTSLTAAEQFWYILMCISFGAGYFAKIPAKKAMADFGMVEMTAAEKFWYILMCFPMGAGYFCKVPVAKAIIEMQHRAGAS
jgi:hypothetical protein